MTTEQSGTEYQDLRQAASAVAQSWRAELTAFAREQFAALAGQKADTVLEFTPAEIILGRDTRAGFAEVARVARNDQLALQGQIAAPTGKDSLSRDIVLRLPAGAVLRPHVQLPFASRRALEGALGYEVERLSPLSPDQLYFDFKTAKRGRASQFAELDLRIVRRALVDEAVAVAHGAGLGIGEIRFENDPAPADWRRFPVDRPAFARLIWQRWNLLLLGGLAVLLLILVLFAGYWRGSDALDQLSDDVDTAGLQAARVEKLQHRIDATAAGLNFLAMQKRQPLLIDVLNEITRVLPDGTWLNEIQVDGKTVHIQGYSHRAADLIGLFERSGRFANAHFGAPLVQGPTPDVDRFDLSVDVVGPAK